MRGGCQAGFALLTETFGFDTALYAGRRVLLGQGDTVPFRGLPRIPNLVMGRSLRDAVVDGRPSTLTCPASIRLCK